METNPLINIVIPVYNEELVLRASVLKIDAFLKTSGFPYRYRIIIVDNASTDKTEDIGKNLSSTTPNCKYIRMTEKGKGRAIRRGFEEPADIHSFMDVDLASDLKSFQALIENIIKNGVNLSIGSRLGKDSKIIGRRFSRELISRAYNLLVRIFFQTGIEDHQCGFKAIDSRSYNLISKDLKAAGWFLDTELIVLAKHNNLKVSTVDIVWIDNPDSKVSIYKTSKEIFEELVSLKWRLLTVGEGGKKFAYKIIRFLIGGGLAAAVNFAAFYLLTEKIHLWYIGSVIIAAFLSFIVSFLMQKFWTFKNKSLHEVPKQFLEQCILGVINLLFNVGAVYALVEWAGVHHLLAQFFALGFMSVINYFVYRFVIFKKTDSL